MRAFTGGSILTMDGDPARAEVVLVDGERIVAVGDAALLQRPDAAGAEVVHDGFFDTLTLRFAGRAESVVAAAHDAGYLLHLVDADTLHHGGMILRRR